jgi:hypothetical protein
MSGCGDLFERCKQCAAGCSSALADREWSESSDVGNALSLAVAYSGFLGFYWEAMLPQWFSNRGQQEEYKQWNWGQFSVKMHSAAVIDEQVNKVRFICARHLSRYLPQQVVYGVDVLHAYVLLLQPAARWCMIWPAVSRICSNP